MEEPATAGPPDAGPAAPGTARRGRHFRTKERPPPRRRWARRFLIAINAFVALCLVGAGTVYGYVQYRFSEVKKVSLPGLRPHLPAPVQGKKPPMNILLVGSNSRAELDPSEAAQFGSGTQVPGARSDVTMVLHLDPSTGAASLLSIPRDLFVPLPPKSIAGAVGKIDAALNDGPEHLVEAVSGSLGIPIDHYIELNFDGFQHVIDAMGGVNMDFPTKLRDAYSGLNITQTGCQHLNGSSALAVVRARHLQYWSNGAWLDDPQSDLSRIRRNHVFLKVFVDAVKSKGLNDPLRANAVLGSLVNQITVDSGFGLGGILSVLREYRTIDPNTIPTTTLPITVVGNYHWRGGTYGDVDMPVEPLDQQVVNAFLARPPVTPAPSGVSVQLVNTSGTYSRLAAVAQQLGAAGFAVASTTQGSSPAQVSETVLHYHPGSVDQARQLLSVLQGAVMMYPDAAVADGVVQVEIGSVLAIGQPAGALAPAVAASPSSSSSSTSTSQPASTGSGTGSSSISSSSSSTTSTSSTIPTAGGQAASSYTDQPSPFDPTAC